MARKHYANRFAMRLSRFSRDSDVYSSENLWCCLCLSAMFLNLIWTCLPVPNANGKYNKSQLQWEEYIDPPNYLQNDSKGSSLPFWFVTDLNIKTAVKMFQLRQSQFYMCRRTMSSGLLLISLLTWTSVQSYSYS